MDLGFVILCPDKSIKGVRSTLASIQYRSYNRKAICVVGNNASPQQWRDLKEVCPTYKGKDTITSLINAGMKKVESEWAFLIFAGSRITMLLEKLLPRFATEEADVLFPVVNGKYDFVDGSFDGVLINKAFYKKVGEFPAGPVSVDGMNDFELSKLMWAGSVLENGGKFKGIVGMRLI